MSEYEIDPTALTVLEQTPALLRTLLTGHSDDVLSHRNPEGWSIVDVVSHLHDVDGIAFTVRIRRILEEHEPRIASIDPSQRPSTAATLSDLWTSCCASWLSAALVMWPGSDR